MQCCSWGCNTVLYCSCGYNSWVRLNANNELNASNAIAKRNSWQYHVLGYPIKLLQDLRLQKIDNNSILKKFQMEITNSASTIVSKPSRLSQQFPILITVQYSSYHHSNVKILNPRKSSYLQKRIPKKPRLTSSRTLVGHNPPDRAPGTAIRAAF